MRFSQVAGDFKLHTRVPIDPDGDTLEVFERCDEALHHGGSWAPFRLFKLLADCLTQPLGRDERHVGLRGGVRYGLEPRWALYHLALLLALQRRLEVRLVEGEVDGLCIAGGHRVDAGLIRLSGLHAHGL